MTTNAQTEARAIAQDIVDAFHPMDDVPVHMIADVAERIITTALAAKDAELAEMRAYAFEATKAITSLTVGGSEFFGKRIGEMYTADLPYCVEHIKDREMRALKRWLEEREKRQRAEAQLAEKNKALEEVIEALDGETEYHEQGMGCGLEDRGIADRYEAMAHGWECAMQRVYAEHINPALASARHTREQGGE